MLSLPPIILDPQQVNSVLVTLALSEDEQVNIRLFVVWFRHGDEGTRRLLIATAFVAAGNRPCLQRLDENVSDVKPLRLCLVRGVHHRLQNGFACQGVACSKLRRCRFRETFATVGTIVPRVTPVPRKQEASPLVGCGPSTVDRGAIRNLLKRFRIDSYAPETHPRKRGKTAGCFLIFFIEKCKMLVFLRRNPLFIR